MIFTQSDIARRPFKLRDKVREAFDRTPYAVLVKQVVYARDIQPDDHTAMALWPSRAMEQARQEPGFIAYLQGERPAESATGCELVAFLVFVPVTVARGTTAKKLPGVLTDLIEKTFVAEAVEPPPVWETFGGYADADEFAAVLVEQG